LIPLDYITHWRQIAPWTEDVQVEQDLIISRALIELFSHPEISRALAFRGGTALHKLHLKPARYSEDLDFVQVHQEPIGQTIDAVRASLSPWLGESVNYEQKHARFTLNYEVNSESDHAPPIRLKVEINTREHFSAEGFVWEPLQVDSPWFQGETDIRTYSLEEMLGTKLRALYQRDKGRDLFDLWYALETAELDTEEVVDICREYLDFGNHSVSRAEFEENLHGKRRNDQFRRDVEPLLGSEVDWSFDDAMDAVLSEFIPEFPGDPWEGGE
jgi:predicted nucleotidyltransferase component of viral defense system